jgi:hypothetical protein
MAKEVVTLSISLSAQERALLDRISAVWSPGRSRRASDTIGRLIREKAQELHIELKQQEDES